MDRLMHNTIRGVREISRLRGHIMDHARLIEEEGPHHTLILRDPQLTPNAIEETWQLCQRVFRKSVVEQMRLIIVRTDDSGNVIWKGYPTEPTADEKELIAIDVPGTTRRHHPVGQSIHEVLRILLIRCLGTADVPAISMTQLGADAGYSYKPVRSAVDELSKHIHRYSNGSVILKSFPEEAWTRLLLEADKVRETQRYYAEGDLPRTPASMLSRFRKIPGKQVEHVGIGGVAGAQSHRDIDLIGMPRLDFTVHCPNGAADLGFLQKLDPALESVTDPDGPASVVVHLLRRPANYFHGELADPVECLLDLHEMRLENQAQEFLKSYKFGI